MQLVGADLSLWRYGAVRCNEAGLLGRLARTLASRSSRHRRADLIPSNPGASGLRNRL